MNHWNHRVVKRMVDDGGKKVPWFGIHECFYNRRDENVAEGRSWTEQPVAVEGESVEELRETLQRMLRALDAPVIEEEE